MSSLLLHKENSARRQCILLHHILLWLKYVKCKCPFNVWFMNFVPSWVSERWSQIHQSLDSGEKERWSRGECVEAHRGASRSRCDVEAWDGGFKPPFTGQREFCFRSLLLVGLQHAPCSHSILNPCTHSGAIKSSYYKKSVISYSFIHPHYNETLRIFLGESGAKILLCSWQNLVKKKMTGRYNGTNNVSISSPACAIV